MSEQDIERQPDTDVEGHVWMADGPDTDEDEDTEGHIFMVQPPRDASTEGSPF